MIRSFAAAILLAFALAIPVNAQDQAQSEPQPGREPVLRQVDVPHNYYWREMYIPQLTSGASSLSWSPDGSALVYSMQGSLWRQDIASGEAFQLTAGPGYDYQPDWSPDGSTIIFSRYDEDAIELWTLDVASGAARRLTSNGGVNLEARWSPSGDRIAFVSTFATGRFRIFTAAMDGGAFEPVQFSPERESAISRYYYSTFDHELSPSWSPDGSEIIYVTNPETGYGTGSLWRRAVAGGEPQLVREEETSWRARPDWGPGGSRIIWSSYAGRQWHQLWIVNAAGGLPIPLTYGDFDIFSPRWSPDGRHIAFVSNESGDGRIEILDLPGGARRELAISAPVYLHDVGTLALTLTDEDGRPVAARISVTGSDGRSYAPETAMIHADDNFDRADRAQEQRYFHANGHAGITLPVGPAEVTVWRGLEHAVEHRTVDIRPGPATRLTVQMQPITLPGFDAWQSADVHVHMNYGGSYRMTPERMVAQAAAEDLDIVFNTLVNKEQRIPDIEYAGTQPDPASTADTLLVPAQEFHTSVWGHLGLLGLTSHFLLPDYSSYPGTGLFSLFPDNPTIADLAHQQGAVVGYVHPFDPGAEANTYSTHQVPVDAALGNMDYYETVGFADFHTSADIWYRLLNLGFRISAAGGTDAMANYASLRGPVGLNRTYVLPGELAEGPSPVERRDAWIAGLRAGRSIATNAPLLVFDLNGEGPGGDISLPAEGGELEWTAAMISLARVDHVEIIHNGQVAATLTLDADGKFAAARGTIPISESGWILLRAWSSEDQPEVLDLYPYGTTSPVYVSVDGKPARSEEDRQYMLTWIDLIEQHARTSEDYNDAAERETVLGNIARARAVYEAMR
ncbi:hypothetical protein GCM10009127_12980 [Alteraurantiacibacter aestuarii]|uniref:Amidohydrolase n=1 Tax=Alteraurantiacibacter aestuarii TaxID=650004 RepID=A0A844ZKP7_9SPHN|nr:CehA/McbA family metallohydrolase [Alteraurantiacibacter aestuarii]MXO88113.1 hypothetical protein [Alteraurantiacibacter aestuarii]